MTGTDIQQQIEIDVDIDDIDTGEISQLYDEYKLWDTTYPWYRYSDYIFNFDASYHLILFLFTVLMGNQFPGPRMRKAAEEHTFGSGCRSTSTKKRTPIKLQ